MRETILVVEDEPVVLKAVRLACEGAGFRVLEARTGSHALALLEQQPPALVVLDLMLPDLHGLDLCRQIRGRGNRIPIVMLTALAEEVDKIVGFEVGADDYVVKPFSPRELVARVRAVLRRSSEALAPAETCHFGPITLSRSTREVTVAGRPVHLTRTEFDILATLASHPGRVFPRDELVNLVWGYDQEGNSRLLDVHIRRIREKIERDPSRPEYLLTVREVGYRLVR